MTHSPPPTRVLHAGDFLLDTHTGGLDGLPEPLWAVWSEARYAAATAVFDAAVSHAVDALLLSGRLLAEVRGGAAPEGDGWNFRAAAFLSDQLRRLAAAGIPVHWHGPADQSPRHWPASFAAPVDFLSHDDDLRLAAGVPVRLRQDAVLVGDRVCEVRSPQSLGESGEHGATLLTIGGRVADEFIPCDTVRFHDRTIDATDGTRWDQIEKTMRSHVRQLQDEPGPAGFHAVRWGVRGHGPAWSRLHAAGPHADLLKSVRAVAANGRTPVFAESITPVPDETQLDRWADADHPAGAFAAAVARVSDKPLHAPSVGRAVAVATTLADRPAAAASRA